MTDDSHAGEHEDFKVFKTNDGKWHWKDNLGDHSKKGHKTSEEAYADFHKTRGWKRMDETVKRRPTSGENWLRQDYRSWDAPSNKMLEDGDETKGWGKPRDEGWEGSRELGTEVGKRRGKDRPIVEADSPESSRFHKEDPVEVKKPAGPSNRTGRIANRAIRPYARWSKA
jgi:transcription initiation factor TFIID subunit TAF12